MTVLILRWNVRVSCQMGNFERDQEIHVSDSAEARALIKSGYASLIDEVVIEES